jgi:hypothetical protein
LLRILQRFHERLDRLRRVLARQFLNITNDLGPTAGIGHLAWLE